MASTSRFTTSSAIPALAGVGLKAEHYADVEAGASGAAWFEVHAENYMGAGGPPHRHLSRIREDYPLSVHGVGLSIGAERGLDDAHLARLAAVVERYEPGLVSEHLAWSTHETGFLNDLLPVPYTREVQDRVVRHIDHVQETLGRQMLLENPSTYVEFTTSEISEIEFLEGVVARSGCGLLLDVNNVYVSCTNHDRDPYAYLDAFPVEKVGEIHLGGHAEDADDAGARLLIDAHDREVIDPVWALYRHILQRSGAVPTLIEWDNAVPDWQTLAGEAMRASAILGAASTSPLRKAS
ncbi:MAG: DUF692 domain-containing protein [Pseudomonadota bacterium]